MATKKTSKSEGASDLRSKLKPTPIKSLKKTVDEDNEMIGVQNSNEYLRLEDGKTTKIRIFPAHPGEDNFYVKRKCYWLTFTGQDGNTYRGTVNDSVVHGGTKKDICDEFMKYAKKKWSKDSDRLSCFTGQDGFGAQFTWLAYADEINPDEELKAKVWEFKKMIRDALNKLSFSEEDDDPIEVDPFTDPDEGLPVLVKKLSKPNKKKGENYYEVSFPKKVSARPLTDEEIEYFMNLKPLSELTPRYEMRDFERALEGLQTFDEENDLEMFEDEGWLEIVEEIKEQYDADSSDEDDEDEPKKKVASKKTSKKVVESEEDDEEEEEKPAPKKTSKAGKKKPAPEPEDEEEDDEEESEADSDEDDGLDDLDRNELKKYIRDNDLDVSVKKSMSDDDLREAIREALKEDGDEDSDEEEDDEEEEEKPRAKMSMADLRKRLGKQF